MPSGLKLCVIHMYDAGPFEFFVGFSKLFVLSFGLVNYPPAITENVEVAIKTLTDGVLFVFAFAEIMTFHGRDAIPFQPFLNFVSSFFLG